MFPVFKSQNEVADTTSVSTGLSIIFLILTSSCQLVPLVYKARYYHTSKAVLLHDKKIVRYRYIISESLQLSYLSIKKLSTNFVYFTLFILNILCTSTYEALKGIAMSAQRKTDVLTEQ